MGQRKKGIMNRAKYVLLVSVSSLISISQGFCQSNLQFRAVAQTDERAIRLTWTSTNREVYQIQYANALATNANGSTAWQTLYDDYPSQGTNTFWLDTGNYNLVPAILHPKNMPMRFYRILDKGADTTSNEPNVSITAPTNGAAVSGELTIAVVARTTQPVLSGTKLYVDGQEMRMTDSSTNYVNGSTNYEVDTYSINTCEWGNGTHTLFATAECESGYGDAVNSPPIASGHAVSPFVPVLFSNLVTRISFSQPSFDPSSGQTQQVSAVFAANCNWTLAIRDVYSNAVRTVTGSGSSMLFNWNGPGTGDTNIPHGIYYYYISAQTNGQAYQNAGSNDDSDSGSGGPPSSASTGIIADSMELWAMPADGSGAAVPFVIYPPGFNTDGLTIFEASAAEIQPLRRASSPAASFAAMDSGSEMSADYTGGGSSASSQSAPPAPGRPPTDPIVGIAGLFGIAYDTYSANGTNGINVGPLDNGLGIGLHIPMENYSGNSSLHYAPLPQFTAQANNFIDKMQLLGWRSRIRKADAQLNINDMRGSGTPFNQVDLGVLMCHGTYGNGLDYAASGCLQMYYPITSGSSGQYLRLSEMNLGGSGSNGLKWFAILACNSLQDFNWDDMQNNIGVYPYNGNLHLLLGTDSVNSSSSVILQYWAMYMNFGRGSFSPLTLRASWYQAARDAYSGHNYANTVKFAVAGDAACMNDYVQTNHYTPPQGSWTYESTQVWP